MKGGVCEGRGVWREGVVKGCEGYWSWRHLHSVSAQPGASGIGGTRGCASARPMASAGAVPRMQAQTSATCEEGVNHCEERG